MFKKTKLIEAIEADDLTYVENCGLSEDDIADDKFKHDGIFMNNGPEDSPLFMAVYFGRLNIVKYLTQRGANVNSSVALNFDRMVRMVRMTPLMLACAKGYTDIVEYLIAQRADVNFSNLAKRNSLTKAIENQHINIIKLLLAAGANVNHHDLINCTPLYEAVETKNCEIIKLLVSHGATIDNNDTCCICPYVRASMLKSREMMEMVINCHTDMKKTHICINKALFHAVQDDSFEMVTYLCDQGASVESSAGIFVQGETVLMIAAQNNNFVQGETVLMIAAQNNNFDMVKYLIQQGADPARLYRAGTRRASDYTTNKEIKKYLLEQEENFLPTKANNMAADE